MSQPVSGRAGLAQRNGPAVTPGASGAGARPAHASAERGHGRQHGRPGPRADLRARAEQQADAYPDELAQLRAAIPDPVAVEAPAKAARHAPPVRPGPDGGGPARPGSYRG